jgi:hypothetical protein
LDSSIFQDETAIRGIAIIFPESIKLRQFGIYAQDFDGWKILVQKNLWFPSELIIINRWFRVSLGNFQDITPF